jgi:hypothetical protein
MRRIQIGALALSLLGAGTALGQQVASGPRPGQAIGDFQFVDLTGPNRGRQLSQVEAFGAGPVVLALVNESPFHARELVGAMQKLAESFKAEKLRVFVAFVAGPEAQEAIRQVAREKGAAIPIGFVVNRKELAGYGLNAASGNTVLLYRSRKVHAVLSDVRGEGLIDLARAARELLELHLLRGAPR